LREEQRFSAIALDVTSTKVQILTRYWYKSAKIVFALRGEERFAAIAFALEITGTKVQILTHADAC
jgi:hypothetical protein